MITLHVFPPSPRSFKVLALAEHLGLEYRSHSVDLRKGEQDTPAFLAMNPNGRVPVLEHDGFTLWESNAIAQYLAASKPHSGLLPAGENARADVMRWLCWDLAHWDPACASLIGERVVKRLLSLGPEDTAETARGEKKFHAAAAVLDDHLEGRDYLAGDSLTIADFCVGSPLNLARWARIPLDSYAEIRRWHASLAELPAWRKTFVAPPFD